MKKLLLILFLGYFVFACTGSSDIKEIKDFKSNNWPIANKVVFNFEIKDASKLYNVNYLIRNSIGYPYYNIYLNEILKDSSGKVITSSMDELILFDKKTGKPQGDGLGDLFDNRFLAPKLKNFKFPKAGKYQWIITHNMRPDPLEGVVSMGFEVIAQK